MTVNYGGTPGTISITPAAGEACTVTAQAAEIVAGTALLSIQNSSPQPGLDVTLSVAPLRQPLNNSETTSVRLTWSATGNTVSGTTNANCNGSGAVTFSVTVGTTITSTTPLPPPPTTQTVFTVPTGQLPTAAVTVSPSGTYGNATLVVTLDLPKVLADGSFAELGQFAAAYNIYVAALVPSGVLGLPIATWFVLPATRAWATLSSPIAAYMTGLAQNATDRVVITILQGLNVTGLVGAEIYIGYGTSDTEMLSSGRYRGVYKVQ